MSIVTIPSPAPRSKDVWGILAHVSMQERERILELPYGSFERELKRIKKRLYMRDYMRTRRAAKRAVSQ